MHDMDIGLMGLLMLVGPLVLLALMAGGVYVGVCAARTRRQFGADQSSPRSVLEHRLAAGEVSVEDYY